MEQRIIDRALKWAKNEYFDQTSRQEIQDLLDKDDTKEIVDRFYKDVEFGTGGLRCIIGMGSNRISKYIVRKATQALCQTIQDSFQGKKDLRVAVSYDSRHFSLEFAKEAACVLAGNKIKAYIFDKLTPTPLLSFAVRHLKAQSGIMITASHNPPQYNGYKAYWDTGGQVIPPDDENIINNYKKIDDFKSINCIPFEEGLKNKDIIWIGEEVYQFYYQTVNDLLFHKELSKKEGKNLKIVYTPIHGTGLLPCSELMKSLGYSNFSVVPEQANPDPNFSTVEYPNPEDPKALKLAVEMMERENADIVFGTDPDADRLGIVVKKDKEIHYLNGNQVGVLLLDYMLKTLKSKNQLSKKSVVIKSIVTSELQTAIAKHHGIRIESTLTGFKWMCGLLDEMERKDPQTDFIMASEESYGYLVNSEVRDKDSISAICMASEMALFYKLKGLTLVDVLDEIYTKFGFYNDGLLSLNYYGQEGALKIEKIMDYFRNNFGKEILGEKIKSTFDYLKTLNSNVLGFETEKGNFIYLRPSGTEPKIKIYFLIKETAGDLTEMKKKGAERIEQLKEFFNNKIVKDIN